MLADLFGPPWKSRSVEKRRQAVTEMDSACADHREILLQLAMEDEDTSVRIAAIRQLTSIAELHELSKNTLDSAIRTEAEHRANELMGEEGAVDEARFRDLMKRYPELQLRIAAHAGLSTIRAEALLSLTGRQLLEVLETTSTTDSRRLIAETLSDIEDLESARRILRGKDKNAERIVKRKIDSFRSHARQQAENSARLEKLIEEAEYLASHDWLPEFKERYRVHRRQWDGLEFDIDEDARQRYRQAREIADGHYERQRLVEQARQSQQQLVDELEALLQVTAAWDLAGSFEALPAMQARQQQLGLDWQALVEITQPNDTLLERYDRMSRALRSVFRLVTESVDLAPEPVEDTRHLGGNSSLSKTRSRVRAALERLEWPDDLAELQLAAELRQRLADWSSAQKAAADAYRQKLDGVHKKISSILRLSRAGNLARAKQIAGKVDKALGEFDGKDLAALQERFEKASKTLSDMGDWKNFATEPKYIELCEAMESLAASRDHPDKRSATMKALQRQWKALGHSEISDRYWPRFKVAADQVYQHCAEFFEQRHNTRLANLEQRQQYVEQMRELLEATDRDSNPDFKKVQSSVRKISDSFGRIKDVERKAGQKQWKQFTKFKDAVMAKLEVEYEANIELKQDLVRQAEELAQADARDANLSALKTLQTRWKQVGVTRRSQDQKAWADFKKHGDAVFHKVQELRQAQKNAVDRQLDAYREVIGDIQKLAKSATDLADSDQRFSSLQSRYADLPELPRHLPERLVKGIQRDYRNACDQFDGSRSRIIESRQHRQIEALRSKAEICARQEALGLSPSAQQIEALSRQWDSIELQDEELSRRIEARRSSAQSIEDRSAIEAERRLLCIRLEIAMDVESPAEDRALRRQYQLEQMNKSGLGQQAIDKQELLETMELDWLCMPGAEAEKQKVLDERFRRVLQAARCARSS